jgi:CRISPR system Cascade subunit CasA
MNAQHNILVHGIFLSSCQPPLTLPGVLAALTRDEVDGFAALRPHQAPAWHSFLVQLAGLALEAAGRDTPPTAESEWLTLLRGLTSDFPADEPWCLVVADHGRPAFLQAPVPKDVELTNPVPTADALDLLITARNHDIKQAVASFARPEDWVYALVSLQTGEGFGGAGNRGIARMNGGSSSRPFLGLAPFPDGQDRAMSSQPGAHFRRDLALLLESRPREQKRLAALGFRATGGIGLTWQVPWPEGAQLSLPDLHPWFIEICRRVRLGVSGERLTAWRGTSKAARIDAKAFKGALGDPWAPVHKIENKSFTLSGADFDYSQLVKLLFSGDWALPPLAQPSRAEAAAGQPLLLVAAALARGNSKTEGFKTRTLPIAGRVISLFSDEAARTALHQLAQAQANEIAVFDHALRDGLALAAAGGVLDRVRKEHFGLTNPARTRLDRHADRLFFGHLWRRHQASANADELAATRFAFIEALWGEAKVIFSQALPAIPGPSLFRPRAEARALRRFRAKVRHDFPELFPAPAPEIADDHAA